jgi:hypothetical protein
VSNGVRNGDGGALGDAQQREACEAAVVDDRLEVADEGFKGEVRNISIGETGPALVISHELAVRGEAIEQRGPYRALPVEFDVIQPVGGLDQWHTATRRCHRQIHAIRCPAERNVLLDGLGTSIGR